MKHWKRICLVVVCVGIFAIFGLPSGSQAADITQEEYIQLLCEKLGLGKNLTCDQGMIVLESVGIVPDGGWHCKHPVTCELVAEVQILAIKSAQMGLLRYSPEDTVVIISALSDELHVCSPPKVVEIMPLATTPPPPITPDVKGGGTGSGTGSGSGSGETVPSPSS